MNNRSNIQAYHSAMVQVKTMLERGIIDENDINQNLLQKEFGDNDHWHNLQLDIHPGGIYAKGYYLVRMLFKLDILIENLRSSNDLISL